jgi:hypothetical protein
MAEAVAAFHDLDDAAAHEVVGRQPVDALAAMVDAALGDLAALGQQQVGDRLERRRLAGAVSTRLLPSGAKAILSMRKVT